MQTLLFSVGPKLVDRRISHEGPEFPHCASSSVFLPALVHRWRKTRPSARRSTGFLGPAIIAARKSRWPRGPPRARLVVVRFSLGTRMARWAKTLRARALAELQKKYGRPGACRSSASTPIARNLGDRRSPIYGPAPAEIEFPLLKRCRANVIADQFGAQRTPGKCFVLDAHGVVSPINGPHRTIKYGFMEQGASPISAPSRIGTDLGPWAIDELLAGKEVSQPVDLGARGA